MSPNKFPASSLPVLANDVDYPVAVTVEPAACGYSLAAKICGISESYFRRLQKTGRIGPRGHRMGKRVIFSIRELRAWCDAGMPPAAQWTWGHHQDIKTDEVTLGGLK